MNSEHSTKKIRNMIIMASIPAMAQMFLKMALGVVNKVMVGQMGESVIAGVGVAEQLIFFLLMMFAAVGTGVSTLSSQYIGAKNSEKIRLVFGSAMLFGMIFSVILTGLFIVFSNDILRMMGAAPEIVVQGSKYLSLVSFTVVSVVMTFILTAVLRSYADNKTPMIASSVAMVLDVVIAYFLIFHFGYGIMGVAISALIARNVELLIMITAMQMNKGKFGIDFNDYIAFSKEIFMKIFKIGWPVSIDTLIWQLGGMATTLIILKLGNIVSGVNEAIKIIPGIVMMPIFGIAITTTALIGQDLGRGDYEGAAKKATESLKISFAVVAVISVVLVVLSGLIPNMFKFSEEGKNMAKLAIIIVALQQIFTLPNLVCSSIIRAGGDTKIIIFITGCSMWFVGIPLSFLFGIVMNYGLYGALIGAAIGEGIKASLFYARYRKGIWKKKIV